MSRKAFQDFAYSYILPALLEALIILYFLASYEYPEHFDSNLGDNLVCQESRENVLKTCKTTIIIVYNQFVTVRTVSYTNIFSNARYKNKM